MSLNVKKAGNQGFLGKIAWAVYITVQIQCVQNECKVAPLHNKEIFIDDFILSQLCLNYLTQFYTCRLFTIQ